MMLLWILLLVMPVTNAFYFTEHGTEVILDGNAQVVIRAVLVAERPQEIVSTVTGMMPENVRASVDGTPHEASTGKTDGGYRISLAPVAEGRHSLELSFETRPNPEGVSGGVLYRNTFTAEERVQSYSLSVSLPQGASIAFEGGGPVISPVASIHTDGKRIRLEWSDSLEKGESFTAIAVYTEPGFPWIFLAAVLAAALAVAYGKRSRPKAAKEAGAKKIPVSGIRRMLTKDENAMLDAIMKMDRPLQRDVVAETGFSKSKVSKMLRSLEIKGIVTRKPYGRHNIIKMAAKYASGAKP
ncbi:MAG: hypothetical protein HY365_01895 [Candidatus Aenigmarchaeota archaeon]|nr:hypothetical protein [Candidatus Aenigmarchaeota archaeon]